MREKQASILTFLLGDEREKELKREKERERELRDVK